MLETLIIPAHTKTFDRVKYIKCWCDDVFGEDVVEFEYSYFHGAVGCDAAVFGFPNEVMSEIANLMIFYDVEFDGMVAIGEDMNFEHNASLSYDYVTIHINDIRDWCISKFGDMYRPITNKNGRWRYCAISDDDWSFARVEFRFANASDYTEFALEWIK